MSTEASILAVGPFSPDIAHLLEYSAEHYDSVPEGTVIASEVDLDSTYMTTRDSSIEMAEILGCDFNDLGRWTIDLSKAEIPSHVLNFDYDEIERVLASLKALADKGFTLFYRPSF